MKVKCKHCKNEWDYNGKNIGNINAMVTCPACLLKVKLYENEIKVEMI